MSPRKKWDTWCPGFWTDDQHSSVIVFDSDARRPWSLRRYELRWSKHWATSTVGPRIWSLVSPWLVAISSGDSPWIIPIVPIVRGFRGMVATIGMIVPDLFGRFSGYLSPSMDLLLDGKIWQDVSGIDTSRVAIIYCYDKLCHYMVDKGTKGQCCIQHHSNICIYNYIYIYIHVPLWDFNGYRPGSFPTFLAPSRRRSFRHLDESIGVTWMVHKCSFS